MNNYKRIVSYLYYYGNGEKKNNVGYVRMERKNGVCKVTIHMRSGNSNDKKLGVYFFYREKDQLVGISLGNMVIKKGVGEFRRTMEEEVTNSLQVTLEEMGGIIIYDNQEHFFATQWDDVFIDIMNFYIADNHEEKWKQTLQEQKKEVLKAADFPQLEMQEVEELELNSDDNKPNDTEPVNENHIGNGEQEDEESMGNIEPDHKKNWDKVIEMQDEKKPEPVMEEKLEIESIRHQVTEKSHTELEEEKSQYNTSVNAAKDDTDLDFIKDNKKEENKKEVVQASQEGFMLEKPPLKNRIPSFENRVHNRTPMLQYNKLQNQWRQQVRDHQRKLEAQIEKGKKIFEQFPEIELCNKEVFRKCVKIEPQDIGCFPMETWVLASNSFLLHGYYNYRYLIFALHFHEGEWEYVIGVPGIYEPKERFMAKMFGFEEFCPTNQKEKKTGAFGYWYQVIQL